MLFERTIEGTAVFILPNMAPDSAGAMLCNAV
jgi:hypothetical protein